ncbi:hypothetical protein GJAV_G00241110 [Gymnothorax javanicus]|nr:hypothetical protein GJAV_G00241110 [Gymnothorax javanicus]
MVTNKIRTEYMKKFKDPKWETFSKCYEDLLKYRLSRRMLEQSHNPILWEGSETESENSDRSTTKNNKIRPVTPDEMPPCQTQDLEVMPKDAAESAGVGHVGEPQVDTSAPTDRPAAETVEPNAVIAPEMEHQEGFSAGDPPQKPHASAKPLFPRKQKSLRAKSKQPRSTVTSMGERHPFAMYGWAEQQANMAGKKTHNVLPAGSTTEIHASALRAKTRREVEKQVKNTHRQRVRSAELKKARKTEPALEYNPWITEYMRCFSARAR